MFEERKLAVLIDSDNVSAKYAQFIMQEAAKFGTPPTVTKDEKPEKLLLFTTSTCPNCKAAKMLLDKEGIAYQTLLASDNMELVSEYEIKQAPTLVAVGENGAVKYIGVSEIKKFMAQRKI